MKAHLLVNITGGDLMGDGSLEFTSLVTDSRTTGADSSSLFVALRGINHDGHRFINDLYNRGVRVFMVDNFPSDASAKKGSAFIRVQDTLDALQKIAAWRRNNFRGRVIAITGSTGKTVVKEWLADILSVSRKVVRSPKSYNSQIGVPLSLWNINDSFDVAIIEAGISQPGEMERLASIINPDTVIITNIGEAHGENFHDKKIKTIEKLKLARGAELIIYCLDQPLVREEVRKSFHGRKTLTWSVSDKKADLFAEVNSANSSGTSISFTFREYHFSTKIPFTDRASIENSITAVAAALSEGIDPERIARSVQSLPAVAMRMEVKLGINGSTLIEDYYNSDPGSLMMALDFLRGHAKGNSTVILSDFRQIGGEEKALYSSVAAELKNAGIKRFIGIGEALMRQRVSFSENSQFFSSTEEFLASFRAPLFGNETILLKGARAFGFERIGSLLEQQLHQTRFEINLGAVVHNLNEFRRILSPGTGVMAMVKAFAYGSGSAEIASLLEYNGVNYFAVAYADEGVALRDAGITTPVMVMNADASVMDMMIRYNLEPDIYSLDSYQSFLKAAAHNGVQQYPIHIEIDTGMHRLGFNRGETLMLAGMLRGEERVKVAYIFSHLAGSDDPSLDNFSRIQAERLIEASELLHNSIGYSFGMHLLNSSGIPRFPQYQFSMVRPGIGLYGIGDYPELKMQHTGRFVTGISQVKDIPAGEPVGYGCADSTDHDRTIAIVPVGYADGLRRILGNGHGCVFIAGKRTQLVGNICMDMCMADVTGLDVKTGDNVEIFGENIPIEEVAVWCDTIPYEILTSIPARVKRVYFNE
jgi:Alr-MurF fusion protein